MTFTPGACSRRIEIVANVSIVLMAALAAILLLKRLNGPSASGLLTRPTFQQRANSPATGTHVALAGVDWQKKRRTLLLVLSSKCRYCTESAPFYRRVTALAERTDDLRLVAVLPQTFPEASRYLDLLGLRVESVLQATPAAVGARGTPTLILVNQEGVVTQVWSGRVPASVEREIVEVLGS